jgi:hypothetical protein
MPGDMMDPNMPVPSSTGFEGLPYADNPVGQFIYGQVGQHMQASGFMPMGFSGQNIADQARNQKFLQMHNDLMVRASMADRENYIRTIQGGFRAVGAQFGEQERQSTVKALDAALPYMGMVAGMAPNMLESLGGPRGSQAVMAQKMIMGSRFRFDPVSGQLGMGQESIESMFDVMKGRILSDDISNLRGFTAGQMGDMSQFLLSKGLLASGGVGSQRAGLRELTMEAELPLGRRMDLMGIGADSMDIDDMSPAQIREIMGDREVRDQLQSDPNAVKRMRKFDSERVNRSIESYLDAASAMGEFLGTPNKGIGELMGKLEEMVGPSAMAQLSPQRIAGLVRQTGELARATGVAPEMAQAIQQHAMNQSAAMGLQGMQGLQVAQHAISFGGALRAGGLTPSWGQLSASQATAFDAQLTASATRSKAANRLGAFARMGQAMGGFQTEEAQLLMSQIKTGTLTDIPDRRRMMEILGGEGIDEAQAGAFFSQTFSNQRLVNEFDIGAQVRDLQGPEVRRNMARAINSRVGSRLADVAGVDAIPGISSSIIESIMGLSNEEFADPGNVDKAVVATLQESLGKEAFEERFGAGDEGIAKAKLFGQELVGGLEKSLGRDRNIGGAATLAAVRTMFDPATLEKRKRMAATARVRGVVDQALQPLGRGDVMQRFIGALQKSETGDVSDILGRTLGTTKKETRAAVLKAFEKLQGPMTALSKLKKDAEAESDPVERAKIVRAAQAKQEVLAKAAAGVAKELEIAGIDIDELVLSADEKAKKEKEEKEKEALAAKDPAIKDKATDGDAKSKAERESGGKTDVNVTFPDELRIGGELAITGNKAKLKAEVGGGKRGPGTKP